VIATRTRNVRLFKRRRIGIGKRETGDGRRRNLWKSL